MLSQATNFTLGSNSLKANCVCRHCQTPFQSKKKSAKYCSDRCRNDYAMELGKHRNGYNATIKCEVCGSMFEKISPTHLRRHGITMAQYIEQFPGAPIIPESERIAASARFSGSANPGFQHGGKLSPYSPKFVGNYDPNIAKKSAANKRARGNDNTVVEYYTSRGMTDQQATEALAKRQSTFSLDKMIQKHGEIEGRKKWAARQEKWLASLNSKTDEEKSRIAKAKMGKGSISLAEKEIVSELHARGLTVETQTWIQSDMGRVVADIKVGNKIVEYNGDYWHANPNLYDASYHNKSVNMTASEIWERDGRRHSIMETNGYSIMVVWEHDYNKDKQGTVDKCLTFLTS